MCTLEVVEEELLIVQGSAGTLEVVEEELLIFQGSAGLGERRDLYFA